MNISTKIKEAGKWVLVFVILNVLFDIIQQLLTYIFEPQCYFLDILLELKVLLFQCLSFGVITLLSVKWINRKYYYFVFPIILFLFLSSVFLFGSHMSGDSKMFYILFPSFAYDCWVYGWNIISIVLIRVHPLSGMFEGEIISPENTIYFYVLYAVTPFIYYLGLTCLCNYIVKRKFKS